jgi:hypothetical protein
MKYWSNEGKHSELFEKIWAKYVPVQGESENLYGELVRCFGRINYDMGNNGAGNIWEERLPDGFFDDDEDDAEYVMDNNWEPMFDKLKLVIDRRLIEKLEDETENLAILGNFERVHVIDEVGDALGDYLIKNGIEKLLDFETDAV